MLTHAPFAYNPSESERESASNSYLMSLIAIMTGIPLPIMNLLATGIFYLGNRKSGYFTRWHCTQAMLSQITMFVVNLTSVSWALAILFGPATFGNAFLAWLIVALLVNLIEFVLTIYTAIVTRKGVHVSWWFWGTLTDQICKPSSQAAAHAHDSFAADIAHSPSSAPSGTTADEAPSPSTQKQNPSNPPNPSN